MSSPTGEKLLASDVGIKGNLQFTGELQFESKNEVEIRTKAEIFVNIKSSKLRVE